MSTSQKLKNPSQYDLLFKLLFVGDSKVGKTCLIVRFADDIYNEGLWPTFGPDYKIGNVEVDGARIKLQIWDIRTGGERWGPVPPSYYRSVHGIFIVYDVTNAESFNNVMIWLNEITKHGTENVSKLLVGNKSDLLDSNRAVTFEQGQELAKSMGIEFIETSAKNSTNVEKAFLVLTTQIKERRGSQPLPHYRRGVKLTSRQFTPGQMVPLNNRCGCC